MFLLEQEKNAEDVESAEFKIDWYYNTTVHFLFQTQRTLQ